MIYLKTYKEYKLPTDFDANKMFREDDIYELIILCENHTQNDENLKAQEYLLNKIGLYWINRKKTITTNIPMTQITVSFFSKNEIYSMCLENHEMILNKKDQQKEYVKDRYNRGIFTVNGASKMILYNVISVDELLSGNFDEFFDKKYIKSWIEATKLGLY